MNKRFFATYATVAAALAIAGIAVSIAGMLSIQPNMEDVLQWLPDRSSEREAYQRFCDRFGTDDFFLVRWDGCEVNDRRCDRFVETIPELDDTALIESAASGRDLIRNRPSPRIQSAAQVADQFRGVFFGPNRRNTCVVVGLTDRGMAHRSEAIALVNRAADLVNGLDSDSLVMAGYPAVASAADRLIKASLLYGFVPCCVLSILAASIFIRNLKLVAAILFVAALSAGLCIGSITLTGSTWGAMSSVIPALTYVLTISGSVHLMNYVIRDVDNNDQELARPYSVFRTALRRGWKPCLVSTTTTAVGVLALTNSQFPAIRQFGFYCAVGTAISLACQLILTPVLLQWLIDPQIRTHNLPSFFDTTYRFIVNHGRKLIAGFVVATLFLLAGIPRLESNLEVERFFVARSPVLESVGRIESAIGPVEQTELMIGFPNDNQQDLSARVETVRDFQIQLEAKESISRTISAATWVPPVPTGASVGDVARRAAYRKRITAIRPELEETRYFQSDGDRQWWRISVRFPFLKSTDFNGLNQDVADAFAQHLADQGDDVPAPSLTHTGVSMLYHRGQERLLSDLLVNFAAAFAMICAILLLVLRSWKSGLIAILPNALPALVLFGVLGWCGYAIDLSIAIMACVALGIAVDNTSHFIIMHNELAQNRLVGSTERDSLQRTIGRCGPAMVATTAIISAGFAAFLFGEIAILVRFAISMIATLFIAMLCDLFLLPALLNVFDNRSDTRVR